MSIRSTALSAPVFRPERFDASNPPPAELSEFIRPVAKGEARQRAISPPSTRSLRGCPSCGGSGVEPGSERPCGSCDGEGMVDW